MDVDGCIPCYALKKAVSQIKSNPHNVVCGMIYLPRDVTFNQLIVGSMRMLVMRTAVPFLVCFGYCFYSYMAAAQWLKVQGPDQGLKAAIRSAPDIRGSKSHSHIYHIHSYNDLMIRNDPMVLIFNDLKVTVC